MSQTQYKPTGAAAERILEVATELFYKQGYRATGINEVIKKSGVAKATFYSHFPTKDDLCKVYLESRSENEQQFVNNAISNAKTPVERFMAVITSLEAWAQMTDFRGCAFLNIASEIPDTRSPLRKVGTALYDWIRGRVMTLSQELIESDPEKYGHLDVEGLTSEYMVVFTGAVALSELYHDTWPIGDAAETIRNLIA